MTAAEASGSMLLRTLRIAFSTKALRRYQVGAGVWRFVDLALLVAVSVYLFERSGAAAVGAFGVARTIAPAVAIPVLTAGTARLRSGLVLASCALAAAAASGVAAVVIATDGSVAVLLVASAVTCVGLYSFRPILTSLLPALVRTPEQLVGVNATAGVVDGVATLAAPFAAAAVLAAAGPVEVAVACVAVLLVAALALLPLAPDDAAHTVTHDAPREPWLAGFKALFDTSEVATIIVLTTGQTFVRGALNVLVVVLAVDVLAMGDGGTGLLLGAIGVGALVGFPLALQIARPGWVARSLGLGVALWGLPVLASAAVDVPFAAVALFAVIGLGNDLVDIASFSLLQRLVPERRLAALLGAFETSLYIAMAAGSFVAARLLDAAGVTTALVVVGAVLPVAAIATLWRLVVVDEALKRRDTNIALLQLQALFSPLSMSTVDRLATGVEDVIAEEGDVLMEKGETGDRYLVIEEGTVLIIDGDRVLNTMGAGEGLGEVALVRDVPRTATAVAASFVRAKAISARDFRLAIRNEAARAAADEVVAARLATLDDLAGGKEARPPRRRRAVPRGGGAR